MKPTKCRKIGVFRGKIFFLGLLFQNGFKYQNGDRQFRSTLNVATSCPYYGDDQWSNSGEKSFFQDGLIPPGDLTIVEIAKFPEIV